jgi:hypothetical protein
LRLANEQMLRQTDKSELKLMIQRKVISDAEDFFKDFLLIQ